MSLYRKLLTKIVPISLGIMYLFALAPQNVYAVPCTGLPSINDLIISGCDLTISGVTGVDKANNIETSTTNTGKLTINANANLTLNSGATLAIGSIVMGGGTLATSIDNLSTIKLNTPVYVPDADADGWASTSLATATLTTATASGKRRLSLMRGTTVDCTDTIGSQTNNCGVGATCARDADCTSTFCGTNADADSYFSLAIGHAGTCQASALPYTDCNDANANLATTQSCYIDADSDTYTEGSANICAGVACTNVAGYRNTTSGTDCNAANASLVLQQTCYIDVDGDTYTNGSASICAGAACTSVAGYRNTTAGTDCYDSNANAYPTSTYCSATNRGDGSYDYNCSTTATLCGTIQDYACSSTALTNDYCSGTACAQNTVTGYLTSSVGCGVTGCTCSTTLTRGTLCTAVGGLYPSCTIDTTASYCSAVASGAQTCQ